MIDAAYAAAARADVPFRTVARVSKTYQADCARSSSPYSQSVLLKSLTGYGLVDAMQSGFTQKAADNAMAAFTLDDLEASSRPCSSRVAPPLPSRPFRMMQRRSRASRTSHGDSSILSPL